ncbi:chemotaxis protein CheW [Marinicellulosiphila megalodicopiae]|uniref:chemotaxis protein CheW n=1 Tax=Marinicellulosiphila megalodicopiae TaxID=2724896 RepID=UPI003BAE1C79
MKQAPFQLLSNIARANLKHALGLPAQEEVQEYWSGVAFSLSGCRFVAPMEQVGEIISVPSITRLPGVKSWVHGVANIRGRLIPVMDLASFAQSEINTTALKNRRLLIVESGDVLNGLIVDSVEGMQHFPVENFDQQVGPSPDILNPFLHGSYKHQNSQFTVIALRDLVVSADFMQIAV